MEKFELSAERADFFAKVREEFAKHESKLSGKTNKGFEGKILERIAALESSLKQDYQKVEAGDPFKEILEDGLALFSQIKEEISLETLNLVEIFALMHVIQDWMEDFKEAQMINALLGLAFGLNGAVTIISIG